MGSYLRVNSIIYKENFKINLPFPWLPVYNEVATLNFLTICSFSTTQKIGYLMSVAASDFFWLKFLEELGE